jgi:inorganic pyrophosphatase
MDEPAFRGGLGQSRVISVIEAEQREKDGKVELNGRLIAVAARPHTHSAIKSLKKQRA